MIIKITDRITHWELLDDGDNGSRGVGMNFSKWDDNNKKYIRALVPKYNLLIKDMQDYVFMQSVQSEIFKIDPVLAGFKDTCELFDSLIAKSEDSPLRGDLGNIKEELKGVNKKLNKILC